MIVKRVEKHQIKDNKAIDQLCFKCKNLYNKANFVVRQRFIKSSKEVEQGEKEHAEWIRYSELDKLCKQENWTEYRELPAQTAQQTLKLLEKNWKSFFQAIKEWKKILISSRIDQNCQAISIKKKEGVSLFLQISRQR